MPRQSVLDIIEYIKNREKTVFIVDTSFVLRTQTHVTHGILNVDYPHEVSGAAKHVCSISALCNGSHTLIVPLEVRQEIDEGIVQFMKIGNAVRRDTKREQQGGRAIREYISALRQFNEASMNRDPRFTSLGLLECIDTESALYRNAWAHYSTETFRRHRQKGQDPSLADIAINTLAYAIQHQGLFPCILTRDSDFENIARTVRATTERRKYGLKEGNLMQVSGSNYEVFIYRPNF